MYRILIVADDKGSLYFPQYETSFFGFKKWKYYFTGKDKRAYVNELSAREFFEMEHAHGRIKEGCGKIHVVTSADGKSQIRARQ